MTLYLLPNLLGSLKEHAFWLPVSVDQTVGTLDGLIAESEGGGRRYLKRFTTKKKPHEMPIAHLNAHTAKKDLDFLLEPILKGESWGVVSDAGLPCLADPGAALVKRARELGVHIEALNGPSSITLALMLSGLSGQHFTFRGYIAKEPQKRKEELKLWERTSSKERSTQIFIEAPYRNHHTFEACLEGLHEKTQFCVAVNLTLPDQFIHTAPIKEWKLREDRAFLHKKPAIFLFFSDKK